MKFMSAADLVWAATASLTKENPERIGFSQDEIRSPIMGLIGST
jgi:hypothetical protein